VATGIVATVEGHQGGHVDIGQDVTVDGDEGLVHRSEPRREPDGTRPCPAVRAPRRRTTGSRRHHRIGIGGGEGVGTVAERKDRLVDPGVGQMDENPFEQRDLDHGEQLLGRGVRQGTKPRPLAAHQDDGFH
jgi:hypothetical protein